MQFVAYMKSPAGVVLYDAAGGYQTLSPDNYQIAGILDALKTLVVGSSIELDISRFEIKETLAKIAPDATVVDDPEKGLVLEFPDLNKVITDMRRIEPHLRQAATRPDGVGAMRAFLAHAAQAKRPHSVEELLDFLANNKLPITNDGCVLAWKAVIANPYTHRQDNPLPNAIYVDNHSKSIDNSPARLVFMKPEDVNPDRYIDCSHGLHVANERYFDSWFQDNTKLLVKINPAHFIAVPKSEHGQKARTCAYLILEETDRTPPQEQINRFLSFPIAPHLDGKSVVLTGAVDKLSDRDRKLANRILAVNSVHAAEVPQAPKRKAAAKRGVEPVPSSEDGWLTFVELAEKAAMTVTGVRGMASKHDWQRKLFPDGRVRTQASAEFIERRVARWARPSEIAKVFKTTSQKILDVARSQSWPTRKAGKDIQYQPPRDFRFANAAR